VTLRHRIYGDARGIIFLLDIPPGQATLLHRHDRDMLAVFVNGGRHAHHSTVLRPSKTRSRRAMFVSDPPGFTHSTENIGTDRSLWLPVQEERDGRRAQLGVNVDEKSTIGAAK
jgi:hypothetical protein